MLVKKRDGDIVLFDENKIINAISKAYKELGVPFFGTTTEEFYRQWIDHNIVNCDREESHNILDIESIQNQVQKAILFKDYNVGVAFMKYRDERARDREFGKKLYDFVEQYKNSSNTANATIDDNSNVSNKNIGVLNAEIHKKDNVKGNRYFEVRKLKELFPNEHLYKQYLKDLESHIFYKNDENSFPFQVPYTYSAKEVVAVKYKGKTLCCALDTLYNLVDESETLINKTDNAYAKYPTELFVKDKEGWTNVERLIRKERKRDLVRVSTAFGEDVVVTDNHPMIVNENIDDNVPAIDSLGQKQLRLSQHIDFCGTEELDLASVIPFAECYDNFLLFQNQVTSQYNSINRHLKFDRDFGYVVGFFIGDGHYNTNGEMISFTSNEYDILELLEGRLCKSCGIVTKISYQQDDCWISSVHSKALVYLLKNVFKIKEEAQNRTLPIDIFEYTRDFAVGILEGLIDSNNGWVETESRVSIHLSSRECICQLATLIKEFGFGASMFTQNSTFIDNCDINKDYTLWGIRFVNVINCVKLTQSYKWRNEITMAVESGLKYKDGWDIITSVSKIEDESFLSQNEFIYDITTQTHSFVSNNLFVHNCMAGSMYPFFLHGLMQLGGKSTHPKSLHSFCGLYINFVFSLSGMFAGAVALPETLVYFDYFARQEWGEDYYKYSDKIISADWLPKKMTIKQQIHQHFQNIIHSINQPSGARGQQSAFVNFSIFDKAFFEGMFGNFYFDSETLAQPKWESVQWLQEVFMEWFNAERLRTMLTFPVVSVAMLTTKDGFYDERMFDFVCKEWAEGDSFFVYMSDSIDSLSSCCFKGDTKVLWKSSTTGVKLTTFEELYSIKTNDKNNFRIFHNGNWVSGRVIKLPKRVMYKVVTDNNKEFVMTDNHINVTLHGEKQTKDLVEGESLLFNTQPLNSVSENDEHLTYAEGFVVGLFLRDGSFGRMTKDGIYDTHFSLNENQYPLAKEMIEKALNDLNIEANVVVNEKNNNLFPCNVSSKEFVAFLQKWTLWDEGTNDYNKKVNLNALLQSVEFRKGILEGYSINSNNAISIISSELVSCMEVLITSLGLNSRIDIVDSTNVETEIIGSAINHNHTVYLVHWSDYNTSVNKDLQKTDGKFNNGVYIKIKSIEKLAEEYDSYCIECTNQDEPYFTLPSGLITHNCRLKNKLQTKEFNFTNGNMGVETGSKSVISLNLSRIMQNFFREVIGDNDVCIKDRVAVLKENWENYKTYLGDILERVYKYHIAYNENLFDLFEAKLMPAYDAGIIDLNKQYLTIGLNGLNQSAEFVGMTCNDNADYEWYCQNLFGFIKEMNTAHNGMFNGHKLTFNTEQVPAESLAVKNYNWDKEDGYWTPTDTNLYASYIFKPNDTNIQILEKIRLHGSRFIGDFLDGGSACHLNLDSHLSKHQYKHLLNYARENGCSYLTFNVPNSECQECGYITKHPIKECPKCGSTKIDYYDRIIGYLTKIKNWSSGRQIEQKLRVYEEPSIPKD